MPYVIDMGNAPLRFLKTYYLKADKKEEFFQFFNDGIRDAQGNFVNDDQGRPIEGARKWLTDNGVTKVVAWTVESPSVEVESGLEEQPVLEVHPKEVLLLAATDSGGTDWYNIPAIKQFLRRADVPNINPQPELGIL
jgi:hypothetical protein